MANKMLSQLLLVALAVPQVICTNTSQSDYASFDEHVQENCFKGDTWPSNWVGGHGFHKNSGPQPSPCKTCSGSGPEHCLTCHEGSTLWFTESDCAGFCAGDGRGNLLWKLKAMSFARIGAYKLLLPKDRPNRKGLDRFELICKPKSCKNIPSAYYYPEHSKDPYEDCSGDRDSDSNDDDKSKAKDDDSDDDKSKSDDNDNDNDNDDNDNPDSSEERQDCKACKKECKKNGGSKCGKKDCKNVCRPDDDDKSKSKSKEDDSDDDKSKSKSKGKSNSNSKSKDKSKDKSKSKSKDKSKSKSKDDDKSKSKSKSNSKDDDSDDDKSKSKSSLVEVIQDKDKSDGTGKSKGLMRRSGRKGETTTAIESEGEVGSSQS